MSIRLPSAERYAAQVAKEQFWLPKLAPHLPLQIPEPLAMGNPGCGYPWRWSIYRWLKGNTAATEPACNLDSVAIALAEFLVALQKIDSTNGPLAGSQNFYRGGSLSVYDAETRQAITKLDGQIDSVAVTKVWEEALSSKWEQQAVWLHGDVSSTNLLMQEGKLAAVIDFGSCAVGDPACDLSIAWTFFQGESRQLFKETLGLDNATWARGRGWTLWKALITFAEHSGSQQIISELIDDQNSSPQMPGG
ncbi:MAG: aminoglycoside phosphotransferase family protein [Candidatus Obscuribacterales bacterium]|nr:aminoglycoside phosphotransferase family protein [Candidatus Obscuribacterales bacterium]